ncbi:MAG: sodium ion-translocating decarboxylase subunit beta [Schaedlerella sp.]|nr:sodium ion-translocating decarboxylase subunit beta [Schaedlerella sp.]
MKKWIISLVGILGCIFVIFGIEIKRKESASVAIIGGADGPTSVFVAGKVGDSVSVVIIAMGIILIAGGLYVYKRWRRK